MSQSPSHSPVLQQPIVDYTTAPRRGRPSWMNPRILLFVIVMAGVIGYPVYIYMNEALTQGIKHRSDGYAEVNLKAMSLFPFDQQSGTVNDVPKRFRELDGQKVILTGEMYQPNAAGYEIKDFDLVYSIAKCCFSGPAQVQHFVKSVPTDGKSIPFYSGEVKVKGTLKVDVTYDGGKVASVYHLAVDSVEPL